MPGDDNEVEQWLSEPIYAQAPIIDAAMDSSGVRFAVWIWWSPVPI